jgi:hypothetical protein
MIHAPRGFVGDADLPHKFHRGDAVSTGHHYEHRMKPRSQRCTGFVEYRAGSRSDLTPAPGAREFLALFDAVKASGFPAHARALIGESLIKKVLKARRVIGKLLIKLLECVSNLTFHVNILTKLHGHP